jgi:succinyl-diaminopimelate desuccinylase
MIDAMRRHVRRERLLETAQKLIAAPSWTGQAGPALDALAGILQAEGMEVQRPEAGHPSAPAVVARLDSGRPGPTLQFNGHLDVVHLPHVPPRIEGDLLRGSGSCDMKGGTAAAVEAMLAVRDSGLLPAGSILLTAHDLHEAPWGFGLQVDTLIRQGYVGDGVLLPEPLCDRLPVAGRGQACWRATIRRPGAPVHEVMRPDEPSVIATGAVLVARIGHLDRRVSEQVHPVAGRASAFIGQIHGGEIFNQYPQTCFLEGTRRWLPGADRHEVERDFRALVDGVARESGLAIDLQYTVVRDAFHLDESDPLAAAFQTAYEAQNGHALPTGSKPFVDDGNSFCALGEVAAITHGPKAGGQHTTEEWASIDDLVRVATLYAATALIYCGGA